MGARGTRAVSRPSIGGVRRRDAGGTETARRRQVPVARPGPNATASGSDRPAERILPGACPQVCTRTFPGLGARNLEPARMPESRAVSGGIPGPAASGSPEPPDCTGR